MSKRKEGRYRLDEQWELGWLMVGPIDKSNQNEMKWEINQSANPPTISTITQSNPLLWPHFIPHIKIVKCLMTACLLGILLLKQKKEVGTGNLVSMRDLLVEESLPMEDQDLGYRQWNKQRNLIVSNMSSKLQVCGVILEQLSKTNACLMYTIMLVDDLIHQKTYAFGYKIIGLPALRRYAQIFLKTIISIYAYIITHFFYSLV